MATDHARQPITAVTDDEIADACRGCEPWITPAMVRGTLDTWQPYYADRLSADEAVGLLMRVGKLYEILAEQDAEPERTEQA